MATPIVRLKKAVLLTHRWLGVALSFLFVVWFLSGFVMMYWDYPRVSASGRLARSAPLVASQVRLSPAEAFAAAARRESPSLVRLTMFDGRPVYRFQQGRLQSVVYADTGQPLTPLNEVQARRVAVAWTRLPHTTFVGAQMDEDQWTLNKTVRPLRPFLKYAWANGEEVYVSHVTGEVMQHTTRSARWGAYLGAIPHWLYFTPLRKETGLWRAVVILLSAVGCMMTLFGLVGGLWLYSPAKKYRHRDGPSSVPFAGPKRWHTALGLLFGLFAFTWVLSGLFSMNPLQWSPETAGDRRLTHTLQGASPLPPLLPATEIARLLIAFPATEVEFHHFGQRSLALARNRDGQSLTLYNGSLLDRLPFAAFEAKLAPFAESRIVREYETYYLDRLSQKPLPVYFFRFLDGSTHYIDPASTRVLASYSTLSRWNRWLYHGLHSWDLPWLYAHRPVWDVAVGIFMLGGAFVGFTGLWIGGKRLKSLRSSGKPVASLAAPPFNRHPVPPR